MAWFSLAVDVPLSTSEAAQALLFDGGAAGLEVRDAECLPMPGRKAPPPGRALLVASFDGKAAASAALRAVQAACGARGRVEKVAERDWSVAWRRRIRPVVVGRLWVGPPWAAAKAPPGKVRVVVEPKMAFGTGDHPTTSLCLASVDGYLRAHPGASVLDVGCGTGVLGFAAKKLGAGRVVGVDNDAVAVALAKECAKENGLRGVALSTAAVAQVRGRFDLVLANILANTLVELAPAIAAKVKDRLVLAGVLRPQADAVREAYLRQGLRPRRDRLRGEWVRLELER